MNLKDIHSLLFTHEEVKKRASAARDELQAEKLDLLSQLKELTDKIEALNKLIGSPPKPGKSGKNTGLTTTVLHRLQSSDLPVRRTDLCLEFGNSRASKVVTYLLSTGDIVRLGNGIYGLKDKDYSSFFSKAENAPSIMGVAPVDDSEDPLAP